MTQDLKFFQTKLAKMEAQRSVLIKEVTQMQNNLSGLNKQIRTLEENIHKLNQHITQKPIFRGFYFTPLRIMCLGIACFYTVFYTVLAQIQRKKMKFYILLIFIACLIYKISEDYIIKQEEQIFIQKQFSKN